MSKQNPPTEIKYQAYREFIYERTRVNNGVMALLAGSNLSSHLLQLTIGSKRTLLEVFPNVPHVKNFNLVSSQALEELNDSERHLASMSIPYLLATYEAFVAKTCEFLFCNTSVKVKPDERPGMKALHKYITENYVPGIKPESEKILELLNNLRNDIVHAGGKARQNYGEKYFDEMKLELDQWRLVPGGSIPKLRKGEDIVLGHNELMLTLAVVKELARQVNTVVQKSIPKERWAVIIFEEFKSHANYPRMNSQQRLRGLIGLARSDYKALQIESRYFEPLVK